MSTLAAKKTGTRLTAPAVRLTLLLAMMLAMIACAGETEPTAIPIQTGAASEPAIISALPQPPAEGAGAMVDGMTQGAGETTDGAMPDSMGKAAGEMTGDMDQDAESITDGETTDGEMTEGAMTDGEMTDGEMTDGEMTGGEMTGGEMTGGEMTGSEMTDGAMTGGEMTDGARTGGEMTGSEMTTGDGESMGILAPLNSENTDEFIAELSDVELACIGDGPEEWRTVIRSLTEPGPELGEGPTAAQVDFILCLEDDTVSGILLAGMLPGPGPLSQDTSDCIRAGFGVINPRMVLTGSAEGNAGAIMAGSMTASMVITGCLNDAEWAAQEAALGDQAMETGMGAGNRPDVQCIMQELGGPAELAETMGAIAMATDGQIAGTGLEQDYARLTEALTNCGMEIVQ